MNPSPDATRHEDPVFIERLAIALECLEAGEEVNLQGICADRKDLIPDLEAAIARAGSLPQLHEVAGTVDPMLGQTLGGRYVLRSRVGSGAMGVVYRAQDTELNRDVALKMLRPDFCTGAESEARLEREAEVLASLQHPAIVSVFDRGRGREDQAYLVMPLLEGKTGTELLDAAPHQNPGHASVMDSGWIAGELGSDAPFELNYVRQVATWVAQIARGLAAVHDAGVVHRDVKPSNIFIQSDGNPMLLDFGLVTFGSDSTLAERDTALGTPAYMAPEQLDPRIEPTPAVDIYGLTATLYHFLTFDRPFRGSPSQVLSSMQRGEPIPAERLRPGLPRDLLAILDKGMSKDPRRRYASAADLANDLEAWLDYRPVTARPVPAWARVWRRAWREPVVKTLVAVAAVAVIGAAVKFAIDVQAAGREARRVELAQRIPASTLLSASPLRRVADENLDASIGEVLRELAEIDTEPSPARVMYAGFLRQRGHYDAAIAEMRAVADHYDTPVLRAFVDAYSEHRSGPDFDLDGMPAPDGDADRFALAYHLMWRETWPRIQKSATLIEACAPGRDVIDEFRIFHRFIQAQVLYSGAEQRKTINDAYDALTRLEESRGYRTALSAKGAAMLLLALERNEDAEVAAAGGLAFAPYDFTLWQNRGFAQLRLGRADALDSIERLLALQPKSYSGHEKKLFILLRENEFERAAAWIDEFPFAPGAKGQRQRAICEGRLLLRRAVHTVETRIAAGAAEDGWLEARRLARAAYEKIEATQRPGAAPTREMLLALVVEDPLRHYEALTDEASRDPLNWDKLREVALLMPDSLDTSHTRAVRNLLLQICFGLAPGQQTLKR